MSTEIPVNLPLSSEQKEIALLLVEQCGLQDHAEANLEMMGASGTVLYGLGRCAQYLMDRTPDEIRDMVMLKIDQQSQSG